MSKRGRPKRLGPPDVEILQALVADRPLATLGELTAALVERGGRSVHPATVRAALREAGIQRVRGTPVPAHGAQLPRYGYTARHRAQAPEQRYPSSLTDAEWARVADLFEAPDGPGLPPRHSRRALVDACCYVVRTGCAWRQLPNEFPHWDNVYKTFRRWSAQGKFEALHDRLRAQWRERIERTAAPSAAVLDAQSTRSSPQGGAHGYDAGKKVKGRKRNLVVDTLGLLLAVSVTAASMQDRDAAHGVVARAVAKYPTVQTLFVDAGYAGTCAGTLHDQHGLTVDVVRHPANRNVGRWQVPGQGELFAVPTRADGFVVLAKRWVVERTHAWNERARRLIMHHDRLPAVSEAWVWLTEARLLLRRLAG